MPMGIYANNKFNKDMVPSNDILFEGSFFAFHV